MSFKSEFRNGAGRSMGYWLGRSISIVLSTVVIKDILDGTAEKRIKKAREFFVDKVDSLKAKWSEGD